MPVERKHFGTLDTGEEASVFVLSAGELRASFSDYGATLLSLLLPRGRGLRDDVVLGFGTLSGYMANAPYFGSTVGRYANRIGEARFAMGGAEHRLEANDGLNCLHGGRSGFDRKVWKAEAGESGGRPEVRFSLTSPAGEGGFPGTLRVEARYSLSAGGVLRAELLAESDAPTPVNLTNHAYFNLAGEGSGSVLGHELSLRAERYLELGPGSIPTGRLLPVAGGPFDFRSPRPLSEGVEAAGGYDHCFVLDSAAGGDLGGVPGGGAGAAGADALRDFAFLRDPATGRSLRMATSLPGVQLYSGNYLDGIRGKRGSVYGPRSGLCLETQCFPDSPNRPEFPEALAAPGRPWRGVTTWAFSA